MATIRYLQTDPFETYYNFHVKRNLNRIERRINRLMQRLPFYVLIGYALICSMFLILFFLASNRIDGRICANVSPGIDMHCPANK